MKRLKKLAALALSAVMAVGIVIPTGAAINPATDTGAGNTQTGKEGSITITQTKNNVEYTAYQVFALTYQVGENGKENTYQYIVEKDTIWYEFVTAGGVRDYVTVGNMLYSIEYTGMKESVQGFAIKWKDYSDEEKASGQDQADAAAFAKLALEYYETHKADQDKPENYLGRRKTAAASSGMGDGGMLLSASRGLGLGGGSSNPSEEGRVYIENLPLGYYLVDSTVGTLCALTTAAPNATVEEKNQESAISKEVWTGENAPGKDAYMSDNNWSKVQDASVGSDLYYRITITPGRGAENLVMRDRMGRITMKYDTMNIYLLDGDKTQPLTAGSDYRLYVNEDYKWYSDNYNNPEETSKQLSVNNRIEGGTLAGMSRKQIASQMGKNLDYVDRVLDESYNFGLIFKNQEWTGSKKLVITYQAKLNDDAYLSGNGDAAGYGINAQKIVLTHGGQHNVAMLGSADMPAETFDNLIKNTGETALPSFKNDWYISSQAAVHTYGFDIAKTDGDNKLLADATFQLRTDPDDESTAIELVKLEGWKGNSRDENTFPRDGVAYSLAPEGATNTTTLIEAGYATLAGLDSGTYYIVEIDAPEGYNRLSGPQEIRLISVSECVEITPEMSERDINGLIRAFLNLMPVQVNGKGYDLTKWGWKEHCTTALAMWTLNTDPVTGEEYYTYGNAKQTLQIGVNKDEVFGGDFVVEGGVHLVNLTGAELPHTGGMGTTLFYAAGSLLVIGAGVLLIVKKRMKNEE